MKKVFSHRALLLWSQLVILLGGFVKAQRMDEPLVLDENCTVTVLNRSEPVNEGGWFGIANVPVERGLFRVRIYCTKDGVTRGGQSDFIDPSQINGSVSIGDIRLGELDPLPVSVVVTGDVSILNAEGETTQLVATATLPDNTTRPVPGRTEGTLWSSSNSNIATVSESGLVTAVSRGRVIIQALNEGVQGALELRIQIPDDSDGDGLPDAYEVANGFNPDDPNDAASDFDLDGLSNLEEFLLGSNPRSNDTDGDGLTDGQEAALNTDLLLADTDGDGLLDGDEEALGTNPILADTDGDEVPDGLEIELGLDPNQADVTTTVVGRVVDANDEPVSGANLVIFDQLTTRSDGQGNFQISFVPTTSGDVRASAFLISRGMISTGVGGPVAPVPGGNTDLGDIVLVPNEGAVSGFVFAPDGSPVADALVRVISEELVREVRTDTLGFYLVSGLDAGDLDVQVRDFETGLRGRAGGNLAPDQSTVVDVTLGAFGSVTGLVFARDNQTPVGAGVSVSLRGSVSSETTTDALGRYRFNFVPLGEFRLSASDESGNRGQSSGNLSTTAQVAVNDIGFLGRGSVAGQVRDALGDPAPGTQVTIQSNSLFGGRQTIDLGAGISEFSFDDVFTGPFTLRAVATQSGLAGFATGNVGANGSVTMQNVTIAAAGSLKGIVTEADGVTPVVGARVTLAPSGITTVTDENGEYCFEFIPLGSYDINIDNPSDGNIGNTTGLITEQGQTDTNDSSLTGFGAVLVTVVDGAGAQVPGAQVRVASGGRSQSQNTDNQGRTNFAQVLAGDFSVSATSPVGQLGGSAMGTVAVGANAEVTVMLEAAGAISGSVVMADGETEAPGFQVLLTGPSVRRTATTGTDGGFTFDLIPLGTFTVEVRDRVGNLRARVSDLVLDAQGQQLDELIRLAPVGDVEVVVSFQDGSSFTNVPVTLTSNAPGAASRFSGRTNAASVATLRNVPRGMFAVTANLTTGGVRYFGQVEGNLLDPGAGARVNLVLDDSLVPATSTFYDGNNFVYNVRENGRLQDGTRSVFLGDGGANRGFGSLEIEAGGNAASFTGSPFGQSEEGGREIVLREEGVAGLNVTRKVFVPADGYFARYLEIIENPGTSEAMVTVRVRDHFRFLQKVRGGFNFDIDPRVVATSSGDGIVNPTGDRWVTIDDDEDLDPFLSGNTLPTVAVVIDGEGSPAVTGELSYNTDFADRFGALESTWQDLMVPANGRVILMRFVSEQTLRANANASAVRLGQLPPEAMVGLSSTERSEIVNWQVPADGVGAVAALPELGGQVTGRVLAGDNATAIPRARVSFQSALPFYSRLISAQSDGTGEFNLSSSLRAGSQTRIIPRGGFTLSAVDPVTQEESGDVAGAFGADLVASQDVVFGSTGLLTGVVRRASGEVVGGASIRVDGQNLLRPINTRTATDGSYQVTGLPPGIYAVIGELSLPGGTGLQEGASATIVAGQTSNADVTFPATGEVRGLVRSGDGAPAVNLLVRLTGANFLRAVRTDSGGRFVFPDVSVGMFELAATEPATGVVTSKPLTVTKDAELEEELQLAAVGVIELVVRTVDGLPANRSRILLEDVRGGLRVLGRTGDTGRLQVSVPMGDFRIVAENPANSTLTDEASGTVSTAGEMITVELTVPDDARPTVVISSPLDGTVATESSFVTFTADPSDDIAISRVQFFQDGRFIGSSFSAPYSLNLRLPRVESEMEVVLGAVAFDSAGQRSDRAEVIVTVQPDRDAPVISNLMIGPPADGVAYREGETLSLTVQVSDAATGVDRVEFAREGEVFGTDQQAPFVWNYTLPLNLAPSGSATVNLSATAFDNAQNSAPASQAITVVRDLPPVLGTLTPAGGSEFIEGSLIEITADPSDDQGVVQVDFLQNGEIFARDNTAPFTGSFRLGSGEDGTQTSITVRVEDTVGQTVEGVINLVRRDDLIAPTASFVVPTDGSVITLGDSDVALVIDTSGSTRGSSGADVNGDGINDTILVAEIVAAQQLLDFLDPDTTQVSVIDFSSGAIVEQALTADFALARQALTRIQNRGPGGGTNFNDAMRAGTDQLISPASRRNANAVQLFFSDGSSGFPSNEVIRAEQSGVVVNTFAVGQGAAQNTLQQIADGTRGVFTPVLNAGDLVEILPNIVLFGINQLPVVANAQDETAVREVDFTIASPDGQFSNALMVSEEPFQGLFGLPMLTEALDLTLTVTATDYGDNQSDTEDISVRVLPAENNPQITAFSTLLALPGESVTILGRYFEPAFANNTVTFSGMPAVVTGGNKSSLTVTIPAGIPSGPVVVTAGGVSSEPVDYDFAFQGSVDLTLNDSSGVGLENAQVFFRDLANQSLQASGSTMADGTLSVPSVQGAFTLTIAPQGFLGAFDVTGRVNAQGEMVGVTATPPDTGALQVTVRDPDGTVLPGATVTFAHNLTAGQLPPIAGTSDENGVVFLDQIFPGIVDVTASLTNFTSRASLATVTAGSTTDLVLELSPRGNSLPVIDYPGERDLWQIDVPANVEIVVTLDELPDPEFQGLSDPYLEIYNDLGEYITEDDDGGLEGEGLNSRAVFEVSVATTIVIVARAYDEEIGRYDLQVSIGDGASFEPNPFIGGSVVGVAEGFAGDEGAPLPLANRRIEIRQISGPSMQATTFTDENGEFFFDNVPFGAPDGEAEVPLGDFEVFLYDESESFTETCAFGNVPDIDSTTFVALFGGPGVAFLPGLPEAAMTFPVQAEENNSPDLGIRVLNGEMCFLMDITPTEKALLIESSVDGMNWSPLYIFETMPRTSEIAVPFEQLGDARTMLFRSSWVPQESVLSEADAKRPLPVKNGE